MAIQNRRGNEANFVASKLLPGEFAVSLDQNKLRICFLSGVVKEIALTEDVTTAITNLGASLTGRIATLETGQETSATQISALVTRIGNAETAITAHDGRLVVLETDNTSAKTRLASIEESIRLININEGSLGSRVSDLETSHRNLSAAFQAQAATLSSHGQSISQLSTKLDNTTATANSNFTKVNNAMTKLSTVENNVNAIDRDVSGLKNSIALANDDLKIKFDKVVQGDDGRLYFYANEELIDTVGPFAGGSGGGQGGGGGAVNNAVLTVRNTGWTITTISASESSLTATFTWSSLENDQPTGDGGLTVYINGTSRISRSIQQGENTVNLSSFIGNAIKNGKNVIRMQISDSYGNLGYLNLTVNLVALSIRSSFDNSIAYTGGFSFPYIMNGEAEKTAYIEVDGTVVATETSALSDRQLTASIPAQTHGAHVIRAWCEADLGVGEPVVSNVLKYEVICVATGNTTPIITSDFTTTEVEQYTNLVIKYRVYDPQNINASVVLKANGETVNTITVDRTEQTWSYRVDNSGALALSITCGVVAKTFNLTVKKSSADIGAVTEGLELYLTAANRSNGEANPATWSYEGINATLTGFNFVTNGWVKDDNGNTVLRVSGDARVTIPFMPFARDFRADGKTIEVEFATRNIKNYDTPIISSWSGDRGLQVTSQYARLKSEQQEVGRAFSDDEHIRLTFVVEKQSSGTRMVLMYINGIPSGGVQYPTTDDFSQITPVGITIGTNDSTTDIYCIRIYSHDLTSSQVLGNMIADMQDVEEMIAAFTRNNIYDLDGNVVISKLPQTTPYMIIHSDKLPTSKDDSDKAIATVEFVDPSNSANNFTASNVQFKVQGTSSAVYPRLNFDSQYKGGFTLYDGTESANYALNENVIPFNRFVLKKDYASSEGANNVELVILHNELNPYTRPEQIADSRVRNGIWGRPIVAFWHNTTTDKTIFFGKYNFNLPKRAAAPYGYSGDMESWEFEVNGTNLMLFKTDYFDMTMQTDAQTGTTKEAWKYSYEARFPSDEWENINKLQEFQSFVYSTYRDEATGNALPSSVTYDGTTYTKDTAEYRLAKFRAEFPNYAELDSFIYYYMFTEVFLMVDSRAKNLFIGFAGSPTTGLTYIDRKAVAEPYDMDTALGIKC